jgi:hypothetical protein
VADQHGGRQVQRPHDVGDVGAVLFDHACLRSAGSGAMTAQIDRHGLKLWRQKRHLRVPVAMRAGEAVEEYDRRPALSADDVMDDRQQHGVIAP